MRLSDMGSYGSGGVNVYGPTPPAPALASVDFLFSLVLMVSTMMSCVSCVPNPPFSSTTFIVSCTSSVCGEVREGERERRERERREREERTQQWVSYGRNTTEGGVLMMCAFEQGWKGAGGLFVATPALARKLRC
jgi:hypothetical protein